MTMTDPIEAAKVVLHGGKFDPNSELTGLQTRRLTDAIGRLLRALYVPPPVEEDEEL